MLFPSYTSEIKIEQEVNNGGKHVNKTGSPNFKTTCCTKFHSLEKSPLSSTCLFGGMILSSEFLNINLSVVVLKNRSCQPRENGAVAKYIFRKQFWKFVQISILLPAIKICLILDMLLHLSSLQVCLSK